MWVCYSVNKEDIWVSRVPLPLAGEAGADAWNSYSPKWAAAVVSKTDGTESLELQDRDPADYARATRYLAKPSTSLEIAFDLRADAGASERFDVELNAARGQCAAILTVKPADIVAGVRSVPQHATRGKCWSVRPVNLQFCFHPVAGGGDEGIEQRLELAGAPEILGMPLHSETECRVGRFDAFDHAVGRHGRGFQVTSEFSD